MQGKGKAKAKTKTKGKAKEVRAISVAIVPYEKVEKDRIYSNYIVVRHTPYDFTIEFCEILPIKEIAKAGQVKAEVKTKIVMPTKIIPELIKALADNYGKYEKAYGEKTK